MINLDRLQRIAAKLSFLRPAIVVLTLVALAITLYSMIVTSEFSTHALEPSIVATVWGLLAYSFIQLFQTIPPPVLPHDSFFEKLFTRIKLVLYTLLAMIVICTTGFMLWMSIRLLLL